MNRGSEALQLFKSFLKPTLLILLWMSGLRLLLFWTIFQPPIDWHPEIPAAFAAGVRFDLLVLGFFWIPVILFTWAACLFVSPRKTFFFWKMYFAVVVLIIFDLSWLDFFWSAQHMSRINHEFFFQGAWVMIDQGWQIVGHGLAWLVTALMALTALALIWVLHKLPMKKDYSLPGPWKIAWQSFVVFLLVASAARGTWTPHHLNIEHAQVSDSDLVNQLPLNAVWNLDK